ncbi:entericidin A [Salmonella enterica subsp. arizonae serovar 18:z4,z23:- str. CVM N7307]|uniref:Entericidin A n=87 Tax=Salmonella enterica TaxID=28901 RepID=Q8ZKB7_SALTY|nr:entericidin A/B family lipoprotein [Salmonella enterica]NP_463199.3 putative entericidin A precursor [Salmonella enterica subsp. enterica serovar Typhimurium str. LT2]ACY91553.1 putative entericidin A precursor [Salmonella enterica subsp. enterica serovar Typhimurium str. 14028S]ADX20106.1 putative entericidin A [Salmonella enterica subsp. enterica serovar Typhimurium str. ST4/74]AEF10132.1 putative entericidin A precursor [Salmonella enterica subsp. enterica serovar Typhimurium str. UK-1]A
MVQRMLRHPIFRASMMKRFIGLVALVLLTSTLLTACNTARGFGEDIQHLGHAISRAAS